MGCMWAQCNDEECNLTLSRNIWQKFQNFLLVCVVGLAVISGLGYPWFWFQNSRIDPDLARDMVNSRFSISNPKLFLFFKSDWNIRIRSNFSSIGSISIKKSIRSYMTKVMTLVISHAKALYYLFIFCIRRRVRCKC